MNTHTESQSHSVQLKLTVDQKKAEAWTQTSGWSEVTMELQQLPLEEDTALLRRNVSAQQNRSED